MSPCHISSGYLEAAGTRFKRKNQEDINAIIELFVSV